MGEGQGSDKEAEAEVTCGRPAGGREVQLSGPRLLAEHLRWASGPSSGGKSDSESDGEEAEVVEAETDGAEEHAE